MNHAKENHVAHLLPYPGRLIGDVGLGLISGLSFSSLYTLFKGISNSNGNAKQCLIEGLQAVHKNGYDSLLGGRFAAWTAVFHTFHFTINAVTPDHKERTYLLSGACVGGFVNMRQGIGAISKWVILGGGIGAITEVLKILGRDIGPMKESYLHKIGPRKWKMHKHSNPNKRR